MEINYSDILITPLANMIKEIGESVAEAQQALDTYAIETQKTINSDQNSELSKIGYRVTWYQMPEVFVELKMSVYYEETGKNQANKRRVFFAPFNAKYQNTFNYKSEGSSTVKFRIVPVPYPISTEKT
jgi:hypothetical protein